VLGVTHGNAGFLAWGRRVESGHGGPGMSATYLWISTDGTDWVELAPPAGLSFGLPISLLTTLDGRYLLIGSTDAVHPDPTLPVVVVSEDGRTWEPVDHQIPPETSIRGAVRGGLGYALHSTHTATGDAGIWFSDDGLRWEETMTFPQATERVRIDDIAAGNEGFVAMGVRSEAEPSLRWERFALASGEGREWIESPMPFGQEDQEFQPSPAVVSIGGDWLAAVSNLDSSARFWRSADGLTWEATSTIPDLGTRLGWDPALVEAGGYLFFNPNRFMTPTPGIWTSTDGAGWEAVDVGGPGAVSAVTTGGGTIVMVGAFVTEDGSRAAMWQSTHEH
jgi:hypothetical protein